MPTSGPASPRGARSPCLRRRVRERLRRCPQAMRAQLQEKRFEALQAGWSKRRKGSRAPFGPDTSDPKLWHKRWGWSRASSPGSTWPCRTSP